MIIYHRYKTGFVNTYLDNRHLFIKPADHNKIINLLKKNQTVVIKICNNNKKYEATLRTCVFAHGNPKRGEAIVFIPTNKEHQVIVTEVI